jgi:AAA family ATP:ADP antiporter
VNAEPQADTRWNGWIWVYRTWWLDRALSVVTKPVYPGEGLSAFLLGTNLFLLLSSYYLLKIVREALILSENGAEARTYATAAQAALLLCVVPAYDMLARRSLRTRLVMIVTFFFMTHLLIFAVLDRFGVAIDVPFFLWLGIFSVVIVAQFWAFASDVYTEEEGKRLFPIVGIGSALGSLVGAASSGPALAALGPDGVMMLAAALLAAAMAATWVVNRYMCATCSDQPEIADQPFRGRGGFRLVFSDRYLMLIALFVLLLNVVNTGGEFLLGKLVVAEADAQALLAGNAELARQAFIGEYYGRYFTVASLLGLLFQVFLVSRIFRWVGIRGALLVTPCIALGGYVLLAGAPLLAVLGATKLLENSSDYSIQNTARHSLFLSVGRDAKYKAKQAIDTVFWRAGDLLQAGLVFAGSLLAFTVRQYALVLLLAVVGWLAVTARLGREYRRRQPREVPAGVGTPMAGEAS